MRLDKACQTFSAQQRATTATSYAYVLRKLCEGLGPARQVSKITPVMLLEYIQDLPENYAPATLHKHIKTIKTMFNWLVKMEVLEKSPAKALKQPRLKPYVTREKAMTDEEYRRLLDYAKWHSRTLALVLFLGDSAARAGGAAGLRVKDIDFDKQTALVTEKGDKTRPVVFGPACAAALRDWLQRTHRLDKPEASVFSKDGEHMDARAISQIIRRACVAAGCRSLGSHSLRHRKGHALADAKVAPSVAATALGHSDPTITLRHYYPADWESAERELRKLTVDHVDAPHLRVLKRVGDSR